MLALAQHRNDTHHKRLEQIEEHSKNIWGILDCTESFIDKDVVTDKAYKKIVSTKEELNGLLLESRHHMKWLNSLHREMSGSEQQEILTNLLVEVEPKTENTIANAAFLFNYFNRVSKYKKLHV